MAIHKFYGDMLVKALNNEIDWDTDAIKVMLCTALTIDQYGDVYLTDVTRTEVSAGGGYTTGGAALTFSGVTPIVQSAGTITLDAEDTVWSSSTITASYAIIYSTVGSQPVISYIDFEGSQSSSNGDFTIAWNASGFGTITVS